MALTIIERNVQLDVYDHDLTPSKIKAIALDSKTRYVGAEIHNGGQTYDVGQDTGVTLTIIRPDKTGAQITGETFQYTIGDGETVYGAYAELTQTALAVSGTLLAQFMLTSGEQILRTEIFTINNGVALDATVSEWAGEYQGYNLDELVQNVNEAVAKVDAMEQDVSELKSGLSELKEGVEAVTESSVGVNLFDGDFDESGFIKNGVDTSNSAYKRTSKFYAIAENSGFLYALLTATTPTFAVVFYDAEKQYISYSGVDNRLTRQITLPDGATFFRCYTDSAFGGNVMLSVTLQSEYIPYELNYYLRKGIVGTENLDENLIGNIETNNADISELKQQGKDSVTEIKKIDDTLIRVGVNLFDGNFDESGLIRDGVDADNPSYKRTSVFYQIDGMRTGNLYVLLSSVTPTFNIFFYDKDKTYTHRSTVDDRLSRTIAIEDTDVYFRCFTDVAFDGNVTISLSQQSEYIPYKLGLAPNLVGFNNLDEDLGQRISTAEDGIKTTSDILKESKTTNGTIPFFVGDESKDYNVSFGAGNVLNNSSVLWAVCAKVSGAGTILIKRSLTSRFIIGTFAESPVVGATALRFFDLSRTLESYELTLEENENYLIIIYYNNNTDASKNRVIAKAAINLTSPTIEFDYSRRLRYFSDSVLSLMESNETLQGVVENAHSTALEAWTSANNRVSKPIESPNGVSGQVLRTNGDGTTEWVDVGLPTDQQTNNAVNAWLGNHPEATTTVQDGSISEQKLSDPLKEAIVRDYVTPEMYGAVGDGTTDDTVAWQDAVDSGLNVFAKHRTYKCGQINVTKNIVINCNSATFTCMGDKLFNVSGAVTKMVENAGDYISYADFSVSDSYSGLAMLTSEDNVITTRDNYMGGFVARFANGICSDRKPVGFKDVTVEEFSPISCVIKNVGNVVHPNSPVTNYTIYCEYGYGCVFENVSQQGEKYNIITLSKCLNCEIKNVFANIDYTGSLSYYYAIEILDSSETYVHDCDIHSEWWHCWTTGGTYFCYDNKVEDCALTVTSGVALDDHDNAVGTKVYNCDLSGAVLFGNSIIKDSRILSHLTTKDGTAKSCGLYFYPTNIIDIGNFTAENIEFVCDKNTNYANNAIGVIISSTAKTTGNNLVVRNVTLKDIFCPIFNENFRCFVSIPSAETVDNFTYDGVVTLDNVVGRFALVKNGVTKFGAYAKMIVKNCTQKDIQGFMLGINASSEHFPIVLVHDSTLLINGIFASLELSNVKNIGINIGTISGTTLKANNVELIPVSSLLAFTRAMVTAMKVNENTEYIYAFVDPSLGNHYGALSASGIVHGDLTT